jgi:aminomethyltransferase
LQKLTDVDLSMVKFYWFTRGTIMLLRTAKRNLENVPIARTGYTAEDGFEIYIPSDEETSAQVWNELLEVGKEFGVVPCGLGSRNTLRLEGRLALYGHEISDTINVWESGVDRWCKMEKPDFIGRAALEKAKDEGLNARWSGWKWSVAGLLAMTTGSRSNWETDRIRYQRIPAPFLRKNIALAYVPPQFAEVGSKVAVEIRGQGVEAQVVPTPFYRRAKKA